MLDREDFEALRDRDTISRTLLNRLAIQGVIALSNWTYLSASDQLVLTKRPVTKETRRYYRVLFPTYRVCELQYIEYSDYIKETLKRSTIGGKQKKKSAATRRKEKLEERRKSLAQQPSSTLLSQAGPSRSPVQQVAQESIKIDSQGGNNSASSDSEEDSVIGDRIASLFSASSGDDTDVEMADNQNNAQVVQQAAEGDPVNQPINMEINRRRMIPEGHDYGRAVEELRRDSSIYWMQDLVNFHLTGPTVYRELIFKNSSRVATLTADDRTQHLPMLINAICLSRMLAIQENGRIPLQVLMIAEMTGLYQEEKTAATARADELMDAACLAILDDPDVISCCEFRAGDGAQVIAPRPVANVPPRVPPANEIARTNGPAMFAEVMRRLRLDRESRPIMTPLAAYTCAVTAVAKKGMVTQACLDKIVNGVKSDLGRQLTLTTELIKRFHDRFPITLTQENVAIRMKAIEDVLPEENVRLKIIIRQAALSGLTCITTIKRAMDIKPDFPWGQVCALFPGEVRSAMVAFGLIGQNPYFGFTNNMEGIASNQYKNLAYVAKEVLVRYQGESALRSYAGFPRVPMHRDRVEDIFHAYEDAINDPRAQNNPLRNDALANDLIRSSANFGY